ncbi:MAG TPA: DUF6603 domain-containing protein [Thermoanaerobaculia bacterium]
MANETTYLIRGAAWLAQALGESGDLFDDSDVGHLGVTLPDVVVQTPEVTDALRQSAAAAAKVLDAGEKLESIASSSQESEILLAFLALGTALAELFIALDKLAKAVTESADRITDPAAQQAARDFARDLARCVADFAISSAIVRQLPQLGFALKVLGLFEWKYLDGDKPLDRPHVRKRLRLDQLKTLISNPAEHFGRTLGWGTSQFNPIDFFELVADFFPLGSTVHVGFDGADPFIKACMEVKRDSTVSPPGLLATLIADVSSNQQTRRELNDAWGISVANSVSLTGGISAQLRPPLAFTLKPLDARSLINGEFRAFFDRNEEKRPFDIVGGTGLVSLSAQNLSAGLGLKAQWDPTQNRATLDPLLFAKLDKLTLKLGADKSDSFVASLLSKADIQGTFDLGLEWAMSTGLKIAASGGVEIALPIHKQLGPIEFATLYLALRIQNSGNLALEISTAIIGNLGPLTATVDRIGAGLDLKFSEKAEGKQGLFDVDLHFKPPNGIGIAINAGVVKGGGFLSIDTERGEYAGALELTIAEFVSVKAIGLITTKMPDGSSGFSLLIIITAEFGSGLQLGFGFTLLGVGGLLGLNRGVRLDPLVQGVRSGAVERIMFPQNVVANAPKIISDLRTYFPAEPGTFLIGPMAKIGWGTPTLLSVSLGVIIQIPPGNVIILGILKVALPADEVAILKLQVAFMGALEVDKKRLWFFAALYDSRILFLTIEGEMGLLVAFGDDANFVVSVGGFHPLFQPPPLPFPVPRRVAISLIDTDYARVRIEGYFAVTSNTVQFGAAVEIYFGFDAINVSGHLAFDALFQFSPFYFIITISASFALNVFGFSLLSVRVRGSLEGPTPWRVSGTASIRILFFDINVDIDVTWGEERHDVLPPVAVLPLLKAELDKKENWRAQLPEANNLLVSLRPLPEDTPLVLHPLGVLRVAQRAVPLELTLDKVGNSKPSDVNRVKLTASGRLQRKNDAYEQFAPAQYQDFPDSEKLSRPAYAPERAGIELAASGADMASSRMVRRVIRTEEILIDTGEMRNVERFRGAGEGLFNHFSVSGAVAGSELSQSAKTKLDPFRKEKIEMHPDEYAVVFQKNNRPFRADTASFRSEATAREFLRQEAEKDPNLVELLHVIPAVERAA